MISGLFKSKSKIENTFVISDIHGCANEFEELIKLLPLNQNSRLIFMGDYIDRGPDSAKVVSKIIHLSEIYECICLKGNHEQMFLDFLLNRDSEEASLFILNGGTATLASYSNENKGYYIPPEHLEFYKNLKLYHIEDKHIFVHAGLPDIPIEDFENYDTKSDFLWLRKTFFRSKFNWKKRVIHGHTPVSECLFTKKRINIDTGCVYGNKLTALHLPSLKTYQVDKMSPPEHIYYTVKGSARKSERFSIDLPVMIHLPDDLVICKAIDFSETGTMLMHENIDGEMNLKLGDSLEGLIGIENKDMSPFVGTVKRIQENSNTSFYGIEFTNSPFDMKDESETSQ